MKPDISLIIACYNEETHLSESVREIDAVMSQTKYSYELVFIDDCSKDGTRNVIQQVVQNRPDCQYVFHKKNIGRGGTVKEGLLMAKSKYAGFLDIDMETHARYIPSMIRLLEKGNDVATVDRVERFRATPRDLLRLVFSDIYKKIAHVFLSIKHPDTESGYKFFNMDTMRNIVKATEHPGWFWDTEIIARAERGGKKLSYIRGVFGHRSDKKSTVRLIPDSISQLKAILRFKKMSDKNAQ